MYFPRNVETTSASCLKCQRSTDAQHSLFETPRICELTNECGRFILRDFTFSEDAAEKQKEELRVTEASERELWVSFCLSCLFLVPMFFFPLELIKPV